MLDLNFSSENMAGWEGIVFGICLVFWLLALINLVVALHANHVRAQRKENGLRKLTTRRDVRRSALPCTGLLLACGAMVVALGSPPPVRAEITFSQQAYAITVLACAALLFATVACDFIDDRRQDGYYKEYADYLERQKGQTQ